MADCPAVSEREQIRDEMKRAMAKAASRLDEQYRDLEDLLKKKSLTKADRQGILNAVDKARSTINNTIPFIHTQFDEAMDRTVMEAKGEIEAFYTNAVMRAGREALAGDHSVTPPVQLLG